MPPPTILAHKTDFLTSQTLQLSRALAPSNAWRTANRSVAENEATEESSAPPLSDKVVDDALYRLNHALQQHARRVYAPQATRHVAEQIEALYLEAGERALRSREEDEDEDAEMIDGALGGEGQVKRLRVGLDFTTDTAIASLPPTWDQHPNATTAQQAEAHPPEANRYADLAAQLTTLSRKRREARERVARLRRMRDLLAPFSATGNDADGEDKGEEQDNDDDNDEGARIQPNLVTRNGEIEKELERMRFLLVRVAGRVARLPAAAAAAADGKRRNRDASGGSGGGGDEDEDDEDPEVLKRRKIEKLLDAF